MKFKLSLLLAFIGILCLSHQANAAFVIKKQVATTVTATETSVAHNAAFTPKEKRIAKYQALRSMLLDEDWHPKQHHASKSGWEGIGALIFALRGIFLFPPAFIVAIVLGAIGMGKGAKHRGMAIAGLAIGLVGAFIWGLIIAMAFA